jgi:sulfide:quinone oxidoreductase
MKTKPRVLIVGGGFGGLESAFMLRKRMHEEADILLVSDSDSFLFKPNTIYIPFGADPRSLLIDLGHPLRKRHISFFKGQVDEVDPDGQRVSLLDGTTLPYDALVLATGAKMRPEEVPGLEEHAETIWSPEALLSLRSQIDRLRDRVRRGSRERVLFLVPPNNKCSGPLYELVFMLETWARREEIRTGLDITYSTCEGSFIQAFGPRLHEVVSREFADRGIEGHTNERVSKVVGGAVFCEDAGVRDYDLLISFPPYAAAVGYHTLPSDDRGFLKASLETRQVEGYPNVYAPGDG